ncbi:hypothetical protein ALC60_06507 [Trachymyrmex zeteki]|uniref:Secreted protein n=1 Tax=Mycetomoellerius zeteki TaxID=64791 RepID=A0A151X2E1_9HYME|nr:hypothetical protein ALC60_06507 [Trachymyrmex zeteki]
MNFKQPHFLVLLSYLALCINSLMRHTISSSYNIHSQAYTARHCAVVHRPHLNVYNRAVTPTYSPNPPPHF